MSSASNRTAVVTGASSGIGEATSLRLAKEGFQVILGARRLARLEDIAARCDGTALELDVTDPASVEAFAEQVPELHLLVNNAGLASGVEPVAELTEERVVKMWETNVLGLLRVTKALMPAIESSNDGHIINIGSTAALDTYPGGAGYTTSKHAVRAISQTLRLELVGKPIRVTEIDPGLVETEFSIVRFDGDREAAKKPYAGMTPLSADDVADCVAWAATRPSHVNVDQIVVKPRAQATVTIVSRSE